MKTIQIPTSSNPCIVVINNTAYSYRAGDTVEVPDEVADAIQNSLELVPKHGRNISKIAQIAEGSITEITADDLDGIEDIAYYAFAHCYSLTSVEIPDTVKSIKVSAFDSCSNLNRVCLPKIPPVLSNTNAFNNAKDTCVFYCKSQESLDAYKSAGNWKVLTGTYSFVVGS